MSYQERTQFLKRVLGVPDKSNDLFMWISSDSPHVVYATEGLALLTDQSGNIVSHAEYLRLRASMDAFYARLTPGDIATHNAMDPYRIQIPPKPKRGGFVYVMRFGDRYKIGMTMINAETRRQEMEYELRRHIDAQAHVDLLSTYQTNEPRKLEKRLHAHFESQRLEGEWFALTESDLQEINALAEQSQ